MGYGGTTDPRLLRAITQNAPPDLQPVLLADAWAESSGRLNAVGDNGHSFGPWQEYDQGRGAGLTPQQRMDPVGATRRAAREFAQYKAKGFSGGELAYRAQRPADHTGYVAKVNSYLEDAKRVLSGYRGNGGPALPNQAGQAIKSPAAPGAAGQDQMMEGAVASGLMTGKPLFETVLQAAMTFGGAPAMSQRSGITRNPQGAAAFEGGGPVNAAKRYLGTPYVWGAGGPGGPTTAVGHGTRPLTGFDCSSLVQYAWSKAGVSLPRTTYDQIHVGHAVNPHNPGSWQPGDLLFPSTHHVQMYVGNGKVIEAPQTGGHVQIVPVRSSGYIAVRRPA